MFIYFYSGICVMACRCYRGADCMGFGPWVLNPSCPPCLSALVPSGLILPYPLAVPRQSTPIVATFIGVQIAAGRFLLGYFAPGVGCVVERNPRWIAPK